MQTQMIESGIGTRLRYYVRVCAIVALLAQAPMSYAAIYTCVAKDGSTADSDLPCDSAAPSLVPGRPRVNESLGRIALRCERSDYNDWYRAQNPKPTRKEEIAKFKDIVQKCRAALKLRDTPTPPSTAPAPQSPTSTPSLVSGQGKESQPIAKEDCMRLDQIDARHTPPALYALVADCMQRNRDADAVGLFVLAGMNSSFDALRVTDRTAGQARQILIMGLFESLPTSAHDRFETAIKDLMAHPQQHVTLCEQVKKIGPPQYFPAYMVNHGMGAVMGALANQAPPTPLKADFDAAAAWADLQSNYLNCTAT